MQLDLSRWTKLLQSIAVLRAEHQGVTSALFTLEGRHGRAQVQEMRAAGSLEDAQRSRRGDIMDAAAEQLADATRTLASLNTEIGALQRRQAELTQRAGTLRTIEAECRRWAQANGVRLPDADEGPLTARLPAASGPQREFGQGLPSSGPPPLAGATAPLPPRSFGRSAPARPVDLSMDSRLFNSRMDNR